jgi:hypothetical protein
MCRDGTNCPVRKAAEAVKAAREPEQARVFLACGWRVGGWVVGWVGW